MHAAPHLKTPLIRTQPLVPVEPVRLPLRETIDYAMEGKGSGFRFRLAEAAGFACGLPAEHVSALAEGIESFHHASLIFDDLPCMDDASERRGRRCLHRVAGESKSILAALALVNHAYTACWRVASHYGPFSSSAARMVERCIGEQGILEGQDRDLSFDTRDGAKEVKAIAARKTGTLLQLTVVLPAILGGESFGTRLCLSRIARAWGIAYQAMDDFSDLLPGFMQPGKTPFQDLRQQRPNLVVAMGQRQALNELKAYIVRAEQQIDHLCQADVKWTCLSGFHALLVEKTVALSVALEVR